MNLTYLSSIKIRTQNLHRRWDRIARERWLKEVPEGCVAGEVIVCNTHPHNENWRFRIKLVSPNGPTAFMSIGEACDGDQSDRVQRLWDGPRPGQEWQRTPTSTPSHPLVVQRIDMPSGPPVIDGHIDPGPRLACTMLVRLSPRKEI